MLKKKIYLLTLLLTILVFVIIFLSTVGFKTNNFNNLINQKLNEINSKIKLNLIDVRFKLNISNFKFEVEIPDSKISINNRKIDLNNIKFDLNIFKYLNKKNPVSQISILTDENDASQFINFINEYDFNLTRKLILNQITKGKIKISSEIIFDEKDPNIFKYTVNGTVNDAEVKLINNSKIEKSRFDFKIDQNSIALKEIELSLDNIFISSDNININKLKNQFEISGNFRTKKSRINLNNYKKITNFKLDILQDQFIDMSSDNTVSLKVDDKFRFKDLKIDTKINFDELYTNSMYQDLIFFKNGEILVNYTEKELNMNFESNFLFKNKEYNGKDSNNLFKAIYKKKQNVNASVDIFLSNTNNKINSKEFKDFIKLNNLNLPNQDIFFSSENKINFSLNNNNKIIDLNLKSKIKTDEVLINYKSQRIKKYFSNFKDQLKLSKSHFDLEYIDNKIKIGLKSKYLINEINEDVSLNIEKKDNNYFFDLNMDLDSAKILINELDYEKKENIKSDLYVNGIYKDNKEIIFNKIKFNEDEYGLILNNLTISKNDKIQKLDLFKINIINRIGHKNDLEFKRLNNDYYLKGNQFDGARNIKKLFDNSSKSIFSNFKNLNTYIYLDIGKYYIDEVSYLANANGRIQIKNNNIFDANISAKLNNKHKFQLNIQTNKNKQKTTNLEIEQPEPFIKNYKFIKGFKEGKLLYKSSLNEGKTISNLKVIDFKVQEVPVLAKLLTLASLQGIADLLTGEGIRFSNFEMDYETLGNTTNIKEIYAIGPAISLMMEGYIVKDELTSLRGTLVPATTINKTISKIPMLGEILVGKKIGEGVFGVSFKVKGPPKKLKTTVNPIKTLTPRFITRTLEKISN